MGKGGHAAREFHVSAQSRRQCGLFAARITTAGLGDPSILPIQDGQICLSLAAGEAVLVSSVLVDSIRRLG